MTVVTNNRLPVGLQSFKKIREGNYLYVDKSDIIWQLANNGLQYNFLSRPIGLASRCLSTLYKHTLRDVATCLKV